MEMFWLQFVLLSGSFYLVDALCGYESCPKTKPGYINVHLVAHSHDDVGWLKTVDQYFLGTRLDIDRGSVQYILDSVVSELRKNPSRRFMYVETAFFWRWWKSQDDVTKQLVQTLVDNGQLEFVSGGWCMADEGSTHYTALIDQYTLGLRFLNDTFGSCAVPKVGWQIDTFGHSIEHASLFAQMAFDGIFLGRMDYQYKSELRVRQEMEMIWNASPNNLGKAGSLFTSVLYNYYMPPMGFCFDGIQCTDDPINDDPTLDDYNVEEKVRDFLRIAKWWEFPYATGNVLMTMGSDFHYMNANAWFKNLDKLIKYVNNYEYAGNASTRIHAFYSTPSCYLQEVHRSKKELPVKNGDFFPYSNDPYGFWSGYFTSRPNFKYHIRKANSFLQVCKQVTVGAFQGKAEKRIMDKLGKLSDAVGIVQHHDAITGTAKQHVTDDYSRRLAIGVTSCEDILGEAFGKLQQQRPLNLTLSTSLPFPNVSHYQPTKGNSFEFCQTLNISACQPSESRSSFILSIYNPLARELRDAYIRIPVTSPMWQIKSKSEYITPDAFIIPKPVLKIPGRESKAIYELVFPVEALPGLTLTNLRVTEKPFQDKTLPKSSLSQKESSQTYDNQTRVKEDIVISNTKGVKITLDGITGLLKSISRGSVQLPLMQNFFYYNAMAGNNSQFRWRASGAYILRPNTSAANGHEPEVITSRLQSFQVYRGVHLTEVHQVYSDWLSQVIRLYEKSDLVEFEWLVGPVPVEDEVGKEIITRYTTNLATKGVFFTDSNGRQLIKRKRDFRDFPFTYYEPVAGNYYPITSSMIISADDNLPLTSPALVCLTDRSQGGTSMNDGEIELLIHRRLLYDDAFGVDEPLNETAYGKGLVTRGKHWLLVAGEGTGISRSKYREFAQEIFVGKVLAFSNVTSSPSPETTLSPKSTALSPLTQILPANIHLLTAEQVSLTQILLRLEHFYEKGEDPVNSSPVRISVKAIMQSLPFVKSLRETTLGANQLLKDVKKFEWKLKNETLATLGVDDIGSSYASPSGEIVLKPTEIKTYLMETA